MRLRVLVFDDILVERPDFLGDLPAEFVYRAHADDAVSDVESVTPDLVLMDYAMGPHRTGAESVAVLRRAFPSEALPIFGISSDTVCNERMIRAGADAAFVKPSAPRRLRVLLERLAQARRGERLR